MLDKPIKISYNKKKTPKHEVNSLNIILVGMPSCGKSTVGVLLAKNLGFRFVDSDLLIQERTGKLLHEIISREGTDGFLQIEEAVNASIDLDRAVIATGGSAVYGRVGMEHLKQNGYVVYLKISYETLCRRLGDYVHRGVVLPQGYTLKDLYDERVRLYEQYADYTVEETAASTLGETVERVTAFCKSKINE